MVIYYLCQNLNKVINNLIIQFKNKDELRIKNSALQSLFAKYNIPKFVKFNMY